MSYISGLDVFMRKPKLPHTYVIIFILILLCAVATWFVPGGQYITSDDGTVSYQEVQRAPQTWQVFSALYNGFVKQAGIIIFILVVGGAFWLLNATGAVTAGISRFISAVGSKSRLVLASIAVFFSLAGAVFGMSEETIPFVAIVVPMVTAMGYDAIVGMLIVYVAANIGFSSAFLNPFTVGVAQQMSDLPLFSGMPYRIFCWVIMTSLTVAFTLIYASRHRKEPTLSQSSGEEAIPLSLRQKWVLVVLLLTVVALIVGVTVFEWYIAEICALFLVMGLVCGAICGFSPSKIADEFIAGAKDILSAALVVGLASGIIVILQDGHIVDSILHGMQAGLSKTGRITSLTAMYGIQNVINLLIPSATAKAAITIPIMAPFSDLVGVSRQATVLAFQFGDGFTNMITPTSGVLMAALAMAKIDYAKWAKWAWKPVLVLIVLGWLLLLPTVLMSLGGF